MRFTFDHIGVYKHLNPRNSVLRKGGGGSSETTTRQISMLPEYARPFYENMMERAEAESLGQYTPYEGDRLAKSSDFKDIGMSKDMIRNIATMDVPGLQDAMDQVGANIGQLGGISNQIGGMMPGMQQLGQRMAGYADKEARQFTGDEVDQYMSPYMDAVLDRQKRGARLDFDRGQAARDASAVQAAASRNRWSAVWIGGSIRRTWRATTRSRDSRRAASRRNRTRRNGRGSGWNGYGLSRFLASAELQQGSTWFLV